MIVITRSRRWAVGAAASAAALAVALAIPVATQSTGATAQAATSRVLATFAKWGSYTWTVPTGTTTVTFTVFGASGSPASSGGTLLSAGGPGGEARGRFAVHSGEAFNVVVGAQGGSGHAFNGGGKPWDPSMGGGGGGSDVRIGGLGYLCAKVARCDYENRIIVGGGGGGGGATSDGYAGGGLVGAGPTGGGGQQSGIGAGWCESTSVAFGCGGDSPFSGQGAGGGGWYGGEPGVYAGAGGDGGSGGSGYVSSQALSGSFPGGTRVGDGKVVISTP